MNQFRCLLFFGVFPGTLLFGGWSVAVNPFKPIVSTTMSVAQKLAEMGIAHIQNLCPEKSHPCISSIKTNRIKQTE
ncbi:hypothetical protein scyTo_0015675 [Scyliorhinus torazame]|uniref:Uncharacterized protein n=1 Tax=Scyliorhinus torazame TaxID=75743 RepID=A0A401PWK6_SCYTO|nr:hypothetical protein [Scyliorhinus torazame]